MRPMRLALGILLVLPLHAIAGDRVSCPASTKRIVDGASEACVRADGTREGPAIERRDGRVVGKGGFKAGKREGVWEKFCDNGTRYERVELHAGKRDGAAEIWLCNGKPSEAGRYRDGVKVGVWKYFVDGQESNRIDYDGRRGAAIRCPPGATFRQVIEARLEYDDDGPVEVQSCEIAGRRVGPYREWAFTDPDKEPRIAGAYVDGLEDGEWIERSPMGEIVSRGHYVKGKKHGQWLEHSLTGPTTETWWKDGVKVATPP
jgi:antitoxin component YwqK of YwqJK toxin-antitoxin module